MPSKRTIITISDMEKRWLMNYTKTHGISMAEAVRRGIACLKASKGAGSYEAPRPQGGASLKGSFVHIVPLDPAYKAGLAGHVPVKR